MNDQASVGRVDIETAQLTAGHGLIFERLLQAPHRGEAQAVHRLETRQTIGTLEELVAEPGVELAGDRAQVGDGSQAPRVGQGLGYRQLVSVLEPERREPLELPAAEEGGAHSAERLYGRSDWLVSQDGDQPGSSVLGVEVERHVVKRSHPARVDLDQVVGRQEGHRAPLRG